MNHLKYIIYREFTTRVKKKSFLLVTILVPIFIGLLMIGTILVAINSTGKMTIAVKDETKLFEDKFRGLDQKNITFHYILDSKTIDDWKQNYTNDYNALIYIPIIDMENPKGITCFSDKPLDFHTETIITDALSDVVRNQVLMQKNYDVDLIQKLEEKIPIEMVINNEKQTGRNSLSGGFGYIAGFLIYMFLFIYGTMVMRGVSEEKTTRIIEVLATMVKPFYLMLGKIIGIGMVGLFQVGIWAVLIFGIQTLIGLLFAGQISDMQNVQSVGNYEQAQVSVQMINESIEALNSFSLIRIFLSFIFYFFFGYVFYAAQFAAIGSAVTDDTDVQSLTLPVTIPIILSIVLMSVVVEQPYSPVAFWASMIPFSSPVVMMARIPYDINWWEQILSMFILLISSIGMVYIASRVYRIGILTQGKKVQFKELWKWLWAKY
ncbi:MAG: ABC transporter permease [Chitinophagales bacterium]|nr:ABC transporter permease [Chitinophagales bacterium]